MSVPTILVTGCAGYIGSTLVGRLLAAGCKVIGVDNLMYRNGSALLGHLGSPRFEFHQADVRSYRTVEFLAERADVVIPLAALVGAPLCKKSPAEAKEVNQDAVVHLARFLCPEQLLLYPNTNSGYGATDGGRAVTEADPLNPISWYGVTKCEAEKAVLDHPRGTAFRLATVFGASPRMRLDLMVNDFAQRLDRAKFVQEHGLEVLARPLEIFEPHFKRNFVGVRDVAGAFLHAVLYSGVRPGVYNLGLPTANLTKLELAHRVCDVLGLSREAVTVGEGRDPDQRNYLVANDKILATGFRFEHDLDAGIREVAAVCRSHEPGQLARMRNA